MQKIVGTNYNYFEKDYFFFLGEQFINVLHEYPKEYIIISLYDCIQRKGNAS